MMNIDKHLRTRLRVIIWKQWKVPSKRQWGLQKLGISKDRARQTSYMGDHYQWVVPKTCVIRAISKEKLAPKRTSQLFRLLYRETRFEIKTNRRIRNRTYGGVRG